MITNELTKKIRGAFFVLFAVFTITSTGWTATYYVDFTAGNDSNAGTSDFPWKRCPGMIGWTGSASLAAGDTVYFDKGDTWTLTSTQNQLLNLLGGVTYDGSTWGTGTRAKFTVSSGVEVYVNLVSMNDDHVTYETVLTGFELDCNDQKANGCLIGYGYPMTKDLTGATKRIQNCVVHNCGPGVVGGSYKYAIGIKSMDGHTVSNVEILNNTVYNTDSDVIAIYPENTSTLNSCSNILIRGNNSYAGGRRGAQQGACILIKNDVNNVIVEFNYCHDSNQGITMETYGATFNAPRNIIIRHNIITGILYFHGIAAQSPFTGTFSFAAYSNLIFNNSLYGISIQSSLSGSTATINIYNNTLFSNASNGSFPYEVAFQNTTVTNYTLNFKNNIIYAETGVLPLYDVAGEITAHSNNIYYRNGGGNLVQSPAGIYKTSANLSTYEATAYSTDPTFTNTTNLPTGFTGTYGINMVPDSNGLSIESGNALKNGADLGPNFNGAINLSGKGGVSVRQGLWDIGAYESVSELTPPRNFRIVQ
jgi:hypothetical protein